MGRVLMSSQKTTVDTRTLKRDIQALGKRVSQAAGVATKVAVQQAGAFYMQFDETEAVPYVKNSNGMITVAGPNLEALTDEGVEELLAAQTQIAAGTLQRVVQKGIKEALE